MSLHTPSIDNLKTAVEVLRDREAEHIDEKIKLKTQLMEANATIKQLRADLEESRRKLHHEQSVRVWQQGQISNLEEQLYRATASKT